MTNLFKNGTFKRLFFAVLVLFVAIPTFVVTSYAHEGGRIAGSVIYSIIAVVGMYEILTTLGINKYVAGLTSLVSPIFILLMFNQYQTFAVHGADNQPLALMIKWGIWSWQNWVLIFAFTLIPLLLDSNFRKDPKFWIKQMFVLVVMIIVPLFAKAIWIINIYDFWYVFFFLGISIIADTMAYFGGMTFGKKWFKGKKFAPVISPKKTIAGFVIGLVFSLIFAILGGYYIHVWQDFGIKQDWLEILVSILFGIVLCVISPYGDLLFSWIKRVSGKKDYSNLIPGHGGIFDRVDAMSVVVALSAVLLLFANLI